MKLIGSYTSPFVRKVRVVMAEKKLECEFVPEDVWSNDSSILAYNPLGKVPCLIMDDGSALYDSRVIVEYLDTLTPVGRLFPTVGRFRTETKRWEAMADGMVEAASLVFLEKKRPAAQQSQEWIDRQWTKVRAVIKDIATRLEGKAFCVERQFSVADIAVICALEWLSFRFPELPWKADYPELAVWMDKISARQSLQDTYPRSV